MRAELGQLPPSVRRPLPGARSGALVDALVRTEAPCLTARRARRAERSGASWDPIVWVEARGANVIDADGNVLVDLASGFGVALLGHAHPQIVAAIEAQARKLVHGFGDMHPSEPKLRLLERLAAMAPFPEAKVILGSHGADAIEAALKTALLATGRPGVLAFEGGYHGLSHGPLAICGYSEAFRAPFAAHLHPHVVFAPWPRPDAPVEDALAAVEKVWDTSGTAIGAVVVEPIQGRGGVRLPPAGFLRGLGELVRSRGALVIADEVLVGLGRCGTRWVSVSEGLVPDLLCCGKALGGGMPISACLGRAEVMAAWGERGGAEAIHTATFFGHPIACAAALAALEVMDEERVEEQARERGARWLEMLRAVGFGHPTVVREVRGRGMLFALELEGAPRTTLRAVPALLERGYITLPAGRNAEVLQLLPPVLIDDALASLFAAALDEVLEEVAR